MRISPRLRHIPPADATGGRAAIWKTMLGLFLAITLAFWLPAIPIEAQSQASRTYVSGVGKDTNACTAAAPCLTLHTALAQTAPGGEIYSLDSANYGYVAINKAVSILAGRGATGVLATSSLTGITINAGANDIITLQGLDIDGAGSGVSGIQFNSGASLNIQDSFIRGFTNGISFQPSGSSALSVSRTLISNNATGISFQSSVTSTGIFNDVQIINNGNGIVAQGRSSTALAIATILNSVVTSNSIVGILAGTYSSVSIANSTVANNTVGLQAQSASSLLQASGSNITGNGIGWRAANGGQVFSASENSFGGNASGDTAPPAAPAPVVTADVPPTSLLYAGFNNGIVTTDAVKFRSSAAYDPNGKIGQGLSVPSSSLSSANPVLISQRGTLAFWIRLNSTGDMDGVVSEYPGPPYWKVEITSGSSGNLSIFFAYDGAFGGTGGVQDTLTSDTFNFAAGDWHHFVWTWQGTHHRLYRDGALVNDKIMISPMANPMGANLRIGGGYGIGTATLDELAVYNYSFNLADVSASYRTTSPAAIAASGPHGLDVVAQWAPGNGNVLIMADSGNDFATRADSYSVNILLNGSVVTTSTISSLTGGFGQALIPVTTPLAPGTYSAQVTLRDSRGNSIAAQNAASFEVPATSWLGNNLGIPAPGSVQTPWTAISVSGTELSVWGRTYLLTGGWGLPTQIISQENNLLAAPVDIDFDIGTGRFNLTPQSLSITSKANDVVTWTGTATGSGITATVNGSLEYDGMLLIKLTLAPANGPVTIRTAKLQTAMPAARARYYSWAVDNSGQVVSYDPGVPTSAGVFFSNTYAGNGNKSFTKTRLIPSIVLSDKDCCGLEWFSDNLNGWSVDQSLSGSTPFQQLVVDANSNVRLENDLATQAFTLSMPVTITFGYEATPIKQLPSDWRAMQIGDVSGNGPSIGGQFSVFWSYPDDAIRGQPNEAWRSFALTPGSYSTVAADIATVFSKQQTLHSKGVYIVPYTDQHVLIAPTVTPPNDTATMLGFLQQEVASPDNGWTSMQTRGATDYWLWSFDYNLSQGIVDGIYIDEPYYSFGVSAALISGNGFTDSTSINRNGFNSFGVRMYLKRLRQLFLTYGKRPVVWIDASTGYIAPHMWAFADFVSDGEGISVSAGGPDWIDRYNTTTGINWLFGISRAVKFGWITAFLNEVRYASDPSTYNAYYRSMIAMLQLFDISPVGTYQQVWVNYMQPRVSFGITGTDVAFTGYWNNAAITPDNTAQCSYYKGTNKVLAHCANLSNSSYSGVISFNASVLGLTGSVTITDAESGSSIAANNGTFPLTINRHDYRVVSLAGS